MTASTAVTILLTVVIGIVGVAWVNAESFINSCPVVPANAMDVCVDAGVNFTTFRQQLEWSAPDQETIIFCPFEAFMADDERPAWIKTTQTLLCAQPGQCKLHGPRTILRVRTSLGKAVISGFSFTGASKSALKISKKTAPNHHFLCDCDFVRNRGKKKGGALRAERGTIVTIEGCNFEENRSSQGGAIFNQGSLLVSHSNFTKNTAETGGAIASMNGGFLEISRNSFKQNAADNEPETGPAVLVLGEERNSFDDRGGNTGEDNDGNCRAIYMSSRKECFLFRTTFPPPPTPTTPPTKEPSSISSQPPTTAPNGVVDDIADDFNCEPPLRATPGSMPAGYFNYDENDPIYGPSNWANVDTNTSSNEYAWFSDFWAVNNCAGPRQSPVDLGTEINGTCNAIHEIRTRPGDFEQNSKYVSFSITPNRLRIDFFRRFADEPDPPSADLPDGFGRADARFVEVRIPSDHTINGKRFHGEYTVVHILRRKEKTVMLSSLIDASGEKNSRFQGMLEQWKKVNTCGVVKPPQPPKPGERRGLRDGTEGRLLQARFFNPYHVSLLGSIHFYGYEGTLTHPPCSSGTNWRVMTSPMVISMNQFEELKALLTTKSPCTPNERAGFGECSSREARPLGFNQTVFECSEKDFLSDCVRFGINCDGP